MEVYLSDDTVPVRLGIFCVRMTAAIDLLRHSAAVIHHNNKPVLSRFQLAEMVYLWSRDVITAALHSAVDIDIRWFRAFQKQDDLLFFPLFWNHNVSAVPALSFKRVSSGQMCRL